MILECNKCALSKNKCISGEGPKSADIMIIGQSLGPEELRQEKLFVGKSGELLNNILSKIGLDRKNIYITNIVKGYVPPGQAVSKTFSRICSETHLVNEIKEVKPKVIICVGSVAARFFGDRFIPNSHFFNEEYNCHVIITHHPARLLRSYSDKLRKEFEDSFEKAVSILNGEVNSEMFNPKIQVIKEEPDKLIEYNNILKNIIAVDSETTGLNFLSDKILTVGISDGTYHLGIKFDENTKPIIKKILEKRKIIGQNFKFDYKFLLKEGITLHNNVYFDTKLAHFLIDRESPHNLNALALKYLHTKLTKGTIDFDNVDYTSIDFDKYCIYVGNDAAMTYELYKIFKPIIDKEFSKVFNYVMVPTLVWLSEAEYYGVKIDRAYVKQCMDSTKYELKALESDLINNEDIQNFCKKMGLPIFNVRSPKQLRDFLYDYLHLQCNDKNTSESTLSFLMEKYPKCEFLKKILDYRHLYKSYKTYLVNLLKFSEEDGYIHCEYDQCRTPSGRLASRSPNLQNIPKGGEIAKKIRRSFIARDGYTLIEADYKQMEFRCLAHYSRDPHMIELINEGKDIHRLIASLAYMKKEEDITDEERRIAKSIVFGLMYGRGERSIALQFQISLAEAKNIKNTFFGTFKKAGDWISKVQRFAKQNGYVKNLFGRKMALPHIYSKEKEDIAYALRCAINYPIQSAAADMTNLAGTLIFKKFKELKLDARLLMNIHDALIIECKNGVVDKVKSIIEKIMTEDIKSLSNFRVNLEVDIVTGQTLAFDEKSI